MFPQTPGGRIRALGLPRINSGAQSRSQNALRFAQRVLLEPTG